MKWTTLLLLFAPVVFADNQEKAEKKALEQQAKTFVQEAKDLEKAGRLLEARTHYANSQSFTDSKDATDAIKRIDGEIRKRKDALRKAHQLYDNGQFKPAAETLEEAARQSGSSSMYSYNLALCYRRLGDIPAALGHLDQAAMGTADPKRKLKLKQLRTALVTGEQSPNLKNDDRESANKINQMMESIGFEASVDEGPPTLRPQTEDGAGSVRSALSPVATAARKPARRSVSLCQALSAVKGPLAQTPTVTFDLANCAEDNDRPADAAQLLAHYLEITPSAADVDRVGLRIASLKALAALPGQKGAQVRSLYASASRSLEARRYDDALADFQKAAAAAPEFAPSEWRLALLYEAMGNVEQARRHFSLYRQLDSNPAGQQEADLHLDTLEAKRIMYDQEVDRASPNDLRAIWCHSCESNELRRVRGATTPTSPRCSP